MTKNTRSQKIVNRSLQYRIIFITSVSGVSVSIGAIFCIKFLTTQIVNLLENASVSSEMALAIVGSINEMMIYFVFLIFFAVFLAWIAAFYLSNRIAGPIYNINRILDQHLAGEKNLKIKIRDKDFFSDLTDKLNLILARNESSTLEPK